MSLSAYYFGCWSPDEKGHYFYVPTGSRISYAPALDIRGIDGMFCPQVSNQTQGAAKLTRLVSQRISVIEAKDIDGRDVKLPGPLEDMQTYILSWWDRTADTRMNSNSSFIIYEPVGPDRTFKNVMAIGFSYFPKIAKRQTVALFEIS